MPKSALLVRDMHPRDTPAVSQLAARIWRAHYPSIISHEQIEYMLGTMCSLEALQKQLREKNQRFFLLEDNGALAGYASLEPRPHGGWYLDKLYVDTKRQRGGMGSFLLAHIRQTLRPKAITLRVNRANIMAVNFYFKHGFFIEACDVLQLDHGYVMDDFLMRWDA